MKLESESEFFQRLKTRTLGTFFWERVEPSNECGFPDSHFVIKNRRGEIQRPEGTCEFKFADSKGPPSLKKLLRPSQKAALIEYHKFGGNRRFYLVYQEGMVWLYNTDDAYTSLMEDRNQCSAFAYLEESNFCAWLVSCLGGSL